MQNGIMWGWWWVCHRLLTSVVSVDTSVTTVSVDASKESGAVVVGRQLVRFEKCAIENSGVLFRLLDLLPRYCFN
jgi:hypothetical protein